MIWCKKSLPLVWAPGERCKPNLCLSVTVLPIAAYMTPIVFTYDPRCSVKLNITSRKQEKVKKKQKKDKKKHREESHRIRTEMRQVSKYKCCVTILARLLGFEISSSRIFTVTCCGQSATFVCQTPVWISNAVIKEDSPHGWAAGRNFPSGAHLSYVCTGSQFPAEEH